jgi:heme/copper-type cytochrome/quinol oxidase subunit 4
VNQYEVADICTTQMKSERKKQTYKNHVHVVPLYHYLTFLVMLLLTAGAVYNLITSKNEQQLQSLLFLLLVLTVISVSFHSRSFALKAQDRAIRAEENFRYFVLTGTPLPHKLTIFQIIALRFASDEELVSLVERTIKENLTPKEIKKAVKNWKADYYRA